MPIKLNKILEDVTCEKALYPNNRTASQQEMDEAWIRVGKKNNLSVHETRSIFKVLQRKYLQEKERGETNWKLFDLMDTVQKKEFKTEPEMYGEEDEEYEMLEVQEDEDNNGNQDTTSTIEADFSGRSSNSSSNESPEKVEKVVVAKQKTPPVEEKKLLNSLVSTAVRNITTTTPVAIPTTAIVGNTQQQKQIIQTMQQHKANLAARAQTFLQHKGITLRRTTTPCARSIVTTYSAQDKKEKTTIQLPDAIKRKLSENIIIKESKKPNLGVKTNASPPQVQATKTSLAVTPVTIKTERDLDEFPPGTVITLPVNGPLNNSNNSAASASSGTVVATGTANGFSPGLQEIDFSKDIIFETNANETTKNKSAEVQTVANKDVKDIQIDEMSVPTFFKNLCDYSRHEAFGLYVANVMNRLSRKSAKKLELQILRAATNILSEDSDL